MACLQTNLLEAQAATCELKYTRHKALGSFLSKARPQYPSLPYPARLLGLVQVSGQEITQKELRSMLQQVYKLQLQEVPNLHSSLHASQSTLKNSSATTPFSTASCSPALSKKSPAPHTQCVVSASSTSPSFPDLNNL